MGNLVVVLGTIVFVLLIGWWVTTFFVIVRQKRVKVIELLGKFYTAKGAGLSLKPPYPLATVVGELNLQIQELAVNISAKTSDNSFIEMPVKVQFKVIEKKPKEAFYELDNPEKQIKSYIFNIIRSKASDKTLDDLYKSKNDFEDSIKETLEEKFNHYGYEVVNVLVDEPQPSKEIVKAYNRVLTAKKLKEAMENEAEAEKIKMVKEAEAEAESKKLQGRGIANQRKAIISGFQESIDEMKQIDGINTPDVLSLILLTQYFDTLKDVAQAESNTIMLPSNPSGFTDISEQIRNAVISGNLVEKPENKR